MCSAHILMTSMSRHLNLIAKEDGDDEEEEEKEDGKAGTMAQ